MPPSIDIHRDAKGRHYVSLEGLTGCVYCGDCYLQARENA